MTERIESIEIHPMRGHSRGEWYGTLDDVAESEENAEYWALFGVTHRGNKHCLGEFPTRDAAIFASRGMSRFPPRTRKEHNARTAGRKIIQLELVREENEPSMIGLIALCDDGTIWHRGFGIRGAFGLLDESWQQISDDGMTTE